MLNDAPRGVRRSTIAAERGEQFSRSAFAYEVRPRHRKRRMLWIAVGLVVLGAACGAAFRLAFLIALLVAAAAIVVASEVWRGRPDLFVDAALAIVAPQVGYVLGVCVRAFVYARARRREAALGEAQMTGSPGKRH